MNISRPAIKHNAKLLMSGARPSPFLVALVLLSITYILNLLFMSLSGQGAVMDEMLLAYSQGNFDYVPAIPTLTITPFILIIAISLMSFILDVGFRIYCFHIAKGEKAAFGNLLDGFAIFFKVLWLHILMFIFIYLWTLLLIVPGIIASYRYRMAFFIMLDKPDLSALDCIRLSKRMMVGRKMELFVLDLSFLGWNLLTFLPFVSIYVLPYETITYTTVSYTHLRRRRCSGVLTYARIR